MALCCGLTRCLYSGGFVLALVLGAAVFAGGRDVLGVACLERCLRKGDLFGRVAVDGEERSAVLDAAFIALRFVLGNAHADKGSDDSAYRAAYAESGECAHDWAGGDERADAGDGEGSDAGKEAERTTDGSACGDAGRGTLRGLGVLLVGEGAGAFVVRKEDGDGRVGEASGEKAIDGDFGCGRGRKDSEYGGVFAGHGGSPATGVRLLSWLLVRFYSEGVRDVIRANDACGQFADLLLLFIRTDGAFENDGASVGDDLAVVRVERQILVGDDRLADLLGGFAVGGRVGLGVRGNGAGGVVLRVIRSGALRGLREGTLWKKKNSS